MYSSWPLICQKRARMTRETRMMNCKSLGRRQSSRHQSHLRAVQRTACDGQLLDPWSPISVFELAEVLHQPYRDIVTFGKSVLLTQADSRTTPERQEVPAWTKRAVVPSIGTKAFGVWTVRRGLTHHRVNVVHHLVTFCHEERLQSISPSSAWKDGITDSKL